MLERNIIPLLRQMQEDLRKNKGTNAANWGLYEYDGVLYDVTYVLYMAAWRSLLSGA